MYILIREPVPPGFAVLAAAHESLACFLKFRDVPEVAAWVAGPFHKIICRVSDDEFERAKGFADHVVLTESALSGRRSPSRLSRARSGRRRSSSTGSSNDVCRADAARVELA